MATDVYTSITGIRRRLLWVSAGNVVSKLLMFAANIWIANRVLAEGFGALNVAFSIVNCLALLAFAGIDTLSTREAAGAGQPDLRGLSGQVIALRTAVTVCLIPLTVVAGALVGVDRRITLLYALSLLPSCVLLVNLFYGVEWTWPITAYFIGGRVVYLALLLWRVAGVGDVVWVPLAFGLAITVENVFLLLLWVRRYGVPRLRGLSGSQWRRWRAAVPVTLSSAGLLLHENAATVILFCVSGAGAAGVYSASYRLIYVAVSLTLLLSYVYLARFTRLREAQSGEARALFRRLCALSVGCGAAFSIVCACGAPLLVRVLYDPVYAHSAPLLQLGIWQMVLAPVRVLAFQTLNANHRQMTALRVALVGTALSIAGTAVLIVFHGAMGAALGTVAGETGLAALLYISAERSFRQ